MVVTFLINAVYAAIALLVAMLLVFVLYFRSLQSSWGEYKYLSSLPTYTRMSIIRAIWIYSLIDLVFLVVFLVKTCV